MWLTRTGTLLRNPRPPVALAIWVFIALALYTPWLSDYVGTGNVASDLAAIESLAARGTFYINDSPYAFTIDKFKLPGREVYFSQKSPVFHLVAAGPAWLLERAGHGLSPSPQPGLAILTVLFSVIPMGLLLGLIFLNPWMRTLGARARWGLTALFAVGSLLAPFALTLNHYVPASAALMAAVNVLLEPGRRSPLRLGILCGAGLSLSLVCDVPPAFLFGAGLGLAWLVQGRWGLRALMGLVAGGAPLALLYAVLNFGIYGSPLPPNMHEESMLYYEGSHWQEVRDRAEQGDPGYYQASYARRLFHATVGHRGIYWMMPLLALGTLAALRLARRRAHGSRFALALAAFPPLAIALTSPIAFDLSGGSYGIRHVFATFAPLYCVLAHPALRPAGRPGRAAFLLLGLAGIPIAALGAVAPWSHNTFSAYPPLHNLAAVCLRHAPPLPTGWIGSVIGATALEPEVAWLDLGRAHEQRGDLTSAARAYRRAIAARPDYALARYYLGIALDRLGRPNEAITVYQELLALQPENVGALNNMGVFALRAARPNLARQCFERSESLAPGNRLAYYGRLQLQPPDQAADPESPLLLEALARFPGDPLFLRLQGQRRGRLAPQAN